MKDFRPINDATVVLHLPEQPPAEECTEIWVIEIVDPTWPDRWILTSEIWRTQEKAEARAEHMRNSCHYSAKNARAKKYRRD